MDMSDAEHLIENAIMALEKYPYDEARRVFLETPINIMMAKDSGCPLNAVWEMAMYCDTTLRQDWKEKWEDEAVVHGQWEPYQPPNKSRQVGWICTNCSSVIRDLSNGNTDFCPHCGANMDGGT